MLKSILLTSTAAAVILAANAAEATDFTFTGTIEHWIVPTTGLYEILAFGAQGGGSGGRGAEMGGDLVLQAGWDISLLVGGQGAGLGEVKSAGGGGGSFVVHGITPLVVAGGGGGYAKNLGASPGVVSRQGGGAGGGIDGLGGQVGGTCDSGAGGGFHGNGFSCGASGGESFLNGGAGGASPQGSAGGFGGGGAGGQGVYAAGGGGGYSGGGAAWVLKKRGQADQNELSGGGGSYIADGATGLVRLAGQRGGNGKITINFLTSSVPEPATWVSMITGFGLMGLVLRRRGRALAKPA